MDGLGNHDTRAFADDEVSFDSIDHLRYGKTLQSFIHSKTYIYLKGLKLLLGQSLSNKGWMVVDAWTTVMSPDNECGHYCREPDGHYYTIAVTNRSKK